MKAVKLQFLSVNIWSLYHFEGLPLWLRSEELACQGRTCGYNPWVRKIPREGNGNPLQYSCLEYSMDRAAWQATLHGVTKSQTRLSD